MKKNQNMKMFKYHKAMKKILKTKFIAMKGLSTFCVRLDFFLNRGANIWNAFV